MPVHRKGWRRQGRCLCHRLLCGSHGCCLLRLRHRALRIRIRNGARQHSGRRHAHSQGTRRARQDPQLRTHALHGKAWILCQQHDVMPHLLQDG